MNKYKKKKEDEEEEKEKEEEMEEGEGEEEEVDGGDGAVVAPAAAHHFNHWPSMLSPVSMGPLIWGPGARRQALTAVDTEPTARWHQIPPARPHHGVIDGQWRPNGAPITHLISRRR